MSKLLSLNEKTEINALVAFTDLTLFMKTCQQMGDMEVANWIDSFFDQVESMVTQSGGIVVKFIGDAALIVFEEDLADSGILCLLRLKESIDEWMEQRGFKCRLSVQVHFGQIVAGPFGSQESKKFDIIGKTVNTAATLEAKPFALSAQAFRKLSPESRKLFKKHTPPITYLRLEDRRPN